MSEPPSRRGARHPFHPPSTHFPLALMGMAPIWDFVGLVRAEPLWWQLSFWSIAAGLAAAVPALFTGFLDYAAIPENSPAQRTANRHMGWMLAAVALFTVNLLVRGGGQPPEGWDRAIAFALSLVGLALLVVGGWHGGDLIFRHGVGQDRSRRPNQGSEKP